MCSTFGLPDPIRYADAALPSGAPAVSDPQRVSAITAVVIGILVVAMPGPV
jgi:hypothetical protein